MIVLYILLGLLALIGLILLINVRIIFEYGEETTVRVGALFLNFKVLPSSEKKKKTAIKINKKPSEKPAQKKKSENPLSELTDGLDVGDFIDILKTVITRLANVFSKHLKVRLKSFLVTVSDESPDKAAIKFGALTAACSWLFEYLEYNTRLYPLEGTPVAVNCDFDAKKTKADIKVIIRLRLIHIVTYALGAFFDLVKIKESKSNTSSLKGTVNNERK